MSYNVKLLNLKVASVGLIRAVRKHTTEMADCWVSFWGRQIPTFGSVKRLERLKTEKIDKPGRVQQDLCRYEALTRLFSSFQSLALSFISVVEIRRVMLGRQKVQILVLKCRKPKKKFVGKQKSTSLRPASSRVQGIMFWRFVIFPL